MNENAKPNIEFVECSDGVNSGCGEEAPYTQYKGDLKEFQKQVMSELFSPYLHF